MRKRIVLGITALALLGGASIAGAVVQDEMTAQPEGPVTACVNPDGSLAWLQFRQHEDYPAYDECYDGPGGRVQWTWDAEGDQGPAGNDGTDGANGISGYEVLAPEQRVGNGPGELVVNCPEGKNIISGGYQISATRGGDVDILSSQPVGLTENEDGTWGGTAWSVEYLVNGTAANVKVAATCAIVS